MGWASRANPCSPDGKAEYDAAEAQMRQFVSQFRTRETFEAYCDRADLTTSERIYLETLLPPHLRVDAGEVMQ